MSKISFLTQECPVDRTNLKERKTGNRNEVTISFALSCGRSREQAPTASDENEGLSKKQMPGVMPRIR
jgi:hypothetical protein